MFKKLILLILLAFAVFIVSCSKSSLSNLKELQTKTSGTTKIALLNESGTVKQGSNTLYLEFRNVSDNKLMDVGNVSVNSVMQMAGPPMTGENSVKKTDLQEVYEVKSNFPMTGKWLLNVEYGKGEKVQFALTIL